MSTKLFILSLVIGVIFAMMANPQPYLVAQPDGTTVFLRLQGGPFHHWEEDMQGFTVVREQDNWYVYAVPDSTDSSKIMPSQHRVGVVDPKSIGLQKVIPPPINKEMAQNKEMTFPKQAVGTLKNLVIPFRFSDHTGRVMPSTADLDVLFNSVGGDPDLAPTGSIRDLYLLNSNNKLTVESVVADWVTLPQTEAYYADGQSGLTQKTWEAIRSALDLVQANGVNFSDFDEDGDGLIDAITFLHSGAGAESGGIDCWGASNSHRMWSHKWTLWPSWSSNDGVDVMNYHISPAIWGMTHGNCPNPPPIGHIGVIAHETGHFLGLPDLYDTDGSSRGIGTWGMMANSWGLDGSQYYPPHFSAWAKVVLGWVEPIDLTSSDAGDYTIPYELGNDVIYRISEGFENNEYILLENRQPQGYDQLIPAGGLLALHVDDNKNNNQDEGHPWQAGWPQNNNHYWVAVLGADGDYDLERGLNGLDAGDVYGNGVSELGTEGHPNTDTYAFGNVNPTNHRIYNIATSGSTVTFSYINGDGGCFDSYSGVSCEMLGSLCDTTLATGQFVREMCPETCECCIIGEQCTCDQNNVVEQTAAGFGYDIPSCEYAVGMVGCYFSVANLAVMDLCPCTCQDA